VQQPNINVEEVIGLWVDKLAETNGLREHDALLRRYLRDDRCELRHSLPVAS
jgi:hypothetical protein